MIAGLPVVLALLAPAATVYGPAAPPAPKPASAPAADRQCAPTNPDPNAKTIVVCAVRPQGYRLDPDILAARRANSRVTIWPHNPHETYADHSCATVGPMGCRGGPTINLLAAAATVAEMGLRLAKGQEIGSMFKTEPHPSEYQLYVEAKYEREAKEAEAAAKAKAKADAAKAATTPATPPKP